MTSKTPSFLLAAFCVYLGTASAQDAGNVIPFQGLLANQAGQPLSPSSPSTLVFRLYRQPVGGIAIWEESQPNISVNAGRFSVLLGSRTELPAAPNFNTTLYLGITVDDDILATADVEMRPRQAIVPVINAAYARNADKLRGYDWSVLFGTDDPAEGTLLDSKIRDGSIQSTKLEAHSIHAGLLVSNTISAGQIATEGIDVSRLAQEVRNALVPVGTVIAWVGLGDSQAPVPDGWMVSDGRTIGKVGSGAAYASDRVRSLFQLLWVSFANTTLPIQNPDGTPGTRGGSAEGDFESGKRLPVPDLRGRTPVGAGQGVSLSNRPLGSAFGAESQVLTINQLPPHDHHLFADQFPNGGEVGMTGNNYAANASGYQNPNIYYVYYIWGTTRPATLGRSSSVGNGAPITTIQPSLALTYLIKL